MRRERVPKDRISCHWARAHSHMCCHRSPSLHQKGLSVRRIAGPRHSRQQLLAPTGDLQPCGVGEIQEHLPDKEANSRKCWRYLRLFAQSTLGPGAAKKANLNALIGRCRTKPIIPSIRVLAATSVPSKSTKTGTRRLSVGTISCSEVRRLLKDILPLAFNYPRKLFGITLLHAAAGNVPKSAIPKEIITAAGPVVE